MDLFLDLKCIPGNTLNGVWTSPWECEGGICVSRVIVELENEVAFELLHEDEIHQLKIKNVFHSVVSMGFVLNQSLKGVQILHVVKSDFWPSIGLLLSNQQLLFISDRDIPFHVGLCVSNVGNIYDFNDIVDAITGEPLN